MILVLSEENDIITDIVCRWLHYYQKNFKRINKEQASLYECVLEFDDGNCHIKLNCSNNIIDFDEVDWIWFRRGYLNFTFNYEKIERLPEFVQSNIYGHLQSEKKTLEDFVYFYLKQKKTVNYPPLYNYNKLIALYVAQEIGLRIPKTLVSKNNTRTLDFLRKNQKCISKNIQDVMSPLCNEHVITGQGTIRISKKELAENEYWYSLFQKEITKKYELRIFYWLGECYTAAIFSQLNKKSRIDSRKTEVVGVHSARIVPFLLPKPIKEKIESLMSRLELESGSIDMIVDDKDDFYFLEVNPVGQFHYVSQICNYYIERKIATNLKYEE